MRRLWFWPGGGNVEAVGKDRSLFGKQAASASVTAGGRGIRQVFCPFEKICLTGVAVVVFCANRAEARNGLLPDVYPS
jgi:hypothetical protein